MRPAVALALLCACDVPIDSGRELDPDAFPNHVAFLERGRLEVRMSTSSCACDAQTCQGDVIRVGVALPLNFENYWQRTDDTFWGGSTFEVRGDVPKATGTMTLDRMEYQASFGELSTEDSPWNEVAVSFDFVFTNEETFEHAHLADSVRALVCPRE